MCKLRGEIDDENQTRSLSKLGIRKAIGRNIASMLQVWNTYTYIYLCSCSCFYGAFGYDWTKLLWGLDPKQSNKFVVLAVNMSTFNFLGMIIWPEKKIYTPQMETNMAMEHPPFEDVFPIDNWGFSRVMLAFRGKIYSNFNVCFFLALNGQFSRSIPKRFPSCRPPPSPPPWREALRGRKWTCVTRNENPNVAKF